MQKSDQSGRTVTTIRKLLVEKERAVELSRLMTGSVDSIGIDSAMALLRARRKAKAKGESQKNG